MEEWKEVGEAIKLIDREIVNLSSKLLSVGIKKSYKSYKKYERLHRIATELKSDLEEEAFKMSPDVKSEEIIELFYGQD